ncbi:hypothetical protein AVEN_16346-1 [Araneus ventricosus]|uniref:Uncharacterized protein n=1 Tax=Araneus ventricosus TaxID=182803 RepID=A0A4Y2GPA1_ARAVE|nr:hypothetical protein AVEN_16346-1 [Araneus ventricosus]
MSRPRIIEEIINDLMQKLPYDKEELQQRLTEFVSRLDLGQIGPTAPPTTESNKGRQPSALDISKLGACLGANRDLYAWESPPGTLTTLNAKPKE